ncbi:MAG: XrtA/PEP-CTERM system-associated ATPase [Rhodothalassiaceae bacterium]
MYLKHFKLARYPFQLTPDAGFFFRSRVHARALATITYGLSKQEGFVVITGHVGAGKTTLIDYMLNQEKSPRTVTAHVNTTQIEADNLLELISGDLGLRRTGATKAACLRDLNNYFQTIGRRNGHVLLIIDEVQNLSPGALEELRMLSNFHDKGRPLVQTLLVGQPEFRGRLAGPECEQLRQRVIASYHLLPLSQAEVSVYIEHRLQQAGHKGEALFDDGAYAHIYDETGGIPRKINRLCDRLLLFGYLEGLTRLDEAAVGDVVAEMRAENLSQTPEQGAVNGVEEDGQVLELGFAQRADRGTPPGRAQPVNLVAMMHEMRQELADYKAKMNRIMELVAEDRRRRR